MLRGQAIGRCGALGRGETTRPRECFFAAQNELARRQVAGKLFYNLPAVGGAGLLPRWVDAVEKVSDEKGEAPYWSFLTVRFGLSWPPLPFGSGGRKLSTNA
jgi:hypothetical protein